MTEREGVRNDLARLRGARLVSAVEAEAGRRLSEVVLKQLTGRGPHHRAVPVRRVLRVHTCLQALPRRQPQADDSGPGQWHLRRIRLIPFDVTIPPEERDRSLPEKLRAELRGILAWAVRGCLTWQRDGLREPPEVLAATNAYQTEMDILGDFLDAYCERAPSAQVESSVLYHQYVAWATSNGEKVMTNTAFGLRLAERGFAQCRIGKARTRGWSGLGLVAARAAANADDGADDDTAE